MARSPLFSRLRRLVATARFARREGLSLDDAPAAFSQHMVERRTFLAAAAASAAIASFPACKGRRDPSGVTVAVVGAGIAGLHCAYRLHQAGFAVTLYEASDRVGGRMWTGRGQLDSGHLFELGGELIDSNHAAMWALAEEFDIALDDRWSFETGTMVRETWFVGGERVSSETLLEQTLQVADLMAAHVEAAETDDDGWDLYNAMSLADWLDQFVPVDELPELHVALRAAYTGEFGLEVEEQGCLNLLYLFGIDSEDEFLVFGDSDERYHTHLGNDAFTTALGEALGGERIVLSSPLTSVSGDGPFTLGFSGTEVEADHVVFALPFSTLRLVDLSGLALSLEKRSIIDEVGYGTNAKVMGGFTRRPWWDDHDESGLLTTDLGVQQGWDSTIGQEGVGGVWTNFVGGDTGLASGDGTPEDWFEEVLEDLETIWPGCRDAWDGTAERMHWPTFEWSRGSYTCYRPGQWDYWSLEGVREGNLHFCGEHCSLDFQGWMEGAAETGGLVAAEILDDYEVAHPPGLSAAVGRAFLLPQGSYHGDLNRRLRFRQRRLELLARLR